MFKLRNNEDNGEINEIGRENTIWKNQHSQSCSWKHSSNW